MNLAGTIIVLSSVLILLNSIGTFCTAMKAARFQVIHRANRSLAFLDVEEIMTTSRWVIFNYFFRIQVIIFVLFTASYTLYENGSVTCATWCLNRRPEDSCITFQFNVTMGQCYCGSLPWRRGDSTEHPIEQEGSQNFYRRTLCSMHGGIVICSKPTWWSGLCNIWKKWKQLSATA